MIKKLLRRNTKQRKLILEELKKTKAHPTADMLFRMVRRRLPHISFGTVYRNLNRLRDEGQVLELTCGKRSCRYDGDTRQHYHFFCFKCGRVLDLDIPVWNDLNNQISKRFGFSVDYHRIDFYGYCKDCKGVTKGQGFKGVK